MTSSGCNALQKQRYELRAKIINELATAPSMKLSETLRLLDADIEFWSQQTDQSVPGLLTTINASLARDDQ